MKHITKLFLLNLQIFFMVFLAKPLYAEDSFISALEKGKFLFSARYRFEHVDDAAAVEDADASTLRTTIGWQTGTFRNISARLLLQDVRSVGVDDFNDGTGRANPRTRFAVVADPSETDFLEAYVKYENLADTSFKLGRQIITYRKAPFHRFVGTVLWRQNWQNHDGFTLENKSIKDTTVRYAYVWNVNRIFTDEAVISARANFESDSHLINVQYGGIKHSTLEVYAYLLDFDNAAANSIATYGLRFNGTYPASETLKVLYAVEYAMQDDYANNPANLGEDYFLGELGVNFKLGKQIENLTLKADYELLSGNGTGSFRTPLATGHAYQGWADRFLTTPRDGIQDLYFTAIARVFGFNIVASYHDISSDHDDYDYGTEIDLQIIRPLNKRFTLGIKYSDYDADANAVNVARNGNIAADVSKFWTWLQFSY